MGDEGLDLVGALLEEKEVTMSVLSLLNTGPGLGDPLLTAKSYRVIS